MQWNDVFKLIVGLSLTGACALVGKIIWDWLVSMKNSQPLICQSHEYHSKKITDIEQRLALGAEKFASYDETIHSITRRIDEIGTVKNSVIKTELLLGELQKTVDKMDRFLEKNLDEAFSRIRELEKTE